ncbi:MAG TPA: cation:proton antiporter [Gammaproteobacteria bacterium]|nr:cation:proton antiporter [Gammaproteobacteria bacterium]
MNFLPSFPLQLNVIALFGITLLLGLIGGELARRIRFLPRISGYIAIGFLLGPGGFNIVSQSVLVTARLFVDISLGIILFDLGRQLDFTWLRHDRGLFPMAIAESGITFISIFAMVYLFVGLPWLPSMLAASFAMATSPAVVMMVAHDLSSEGPVTRRTIVLTSLNNFFALVVFTFLLPMTQSISMKSSTLWIHSTYLIIGSLVLGIAIFVLIRMMAILIGKQKQNQFVLFIGALVLTIGIAQILNLPTALTLFILGVATRNFDHKHMLMEIDFGWSARLFFILLFVVTGIHLRLEGLWIAALAVVIFILVRGLAKTLGIWLFSSASRLTKKQILAVSLALTPMAGLAISMSNVLDDFNPDLNRQIATIIASVVAILEILGPIATQFAFIWTRETTPDHTQQGVQK